MLPNSIRTVGALAGLALLVGAGSARAAAPAPIAAALMRIAHEWAHVSYQVPDADRKVSELGALAHEAEKLHEQYPARAEPLIWEGVIVSSQARFASGFDALGFAKRARAILEQAGRIDYRALDGAVPTTLGALYDKVPGFPLGFGNDDKARSYLEQAIAISPDGLDANYFYGSFLCGQDEYAKAAAALKRALATPPHPDRPVWDAGRRAEARELLAKVNSKIASND